jgi:putative endonuclease
MKLFGTAGRTPKRPGATGEDLALAHLVARGLTLLARNYRCRAGEIDLVMRAPDATIVFIEVKERRTGTHGDGLEAVGAGKRRRVVLAAQHYASRHGLFEVSLRFDVCSVEWREEVPQVRWEPGAFDASGR